MLMEDKKERKKEGGRKRELERKNERKGERRRKKERQRNRERKRKKKKDLISIGKLMVYEEKNQTDVDRQMLNLKRQKRGRYQMHKC